MNVNVQIEHEIIKNVIKMVIMNNQSLNYYEKRQAFDNVAKTARQAD